MTAASSPTDQLFVMLMHVGDAVHEAVELANTQRHDEDLPTAESNRWNQRFQVLTAMEQLLSYVAKHEVKDL